MRKKVLFIVSLIGLFLTQGIFAKGKANLQGVEFETDTLYHYVIGPGLTQTKIVFSTNSRKFNAHVLDLNRDKAEGMRIKVDVGHDSCNTAEAITSMARRKTNEKTRYLGGINGDFFITSAFASQHEFGNGILGYPNMSCVTGGKIVAPDMIDITSRENAFIVGSEGLWIDATDLRYVLADASGKNELAATAINYPRRDNELMLYNGYYGHYTKTSSDGREIVLRLADGESGWAVNRAVRFVVHGEWHSGQSVIPEDGLVISCGPKYSNSFIDALKKGDEVVLKIDLSLPAFGGITPDILEVCGGDVRILKEDVTTTEAIRWINTPSAQYSRSLVGYSRDRSHVVLCAVDAGTGSSGVTYYEAADVMRTLGCYDALDLDGGGSTAIWSHSHGIFNTLRDGSERAVGNGLFFVLDAPVSEELTDIRFADYRITLPKYALYQPKIYGYNVYGQLVEQAVDGFELQASDALGEIQPGGQSILVSGTGSHVLTARKGSMTATVTVTVDDTAEVEPSLTSYLIDGYRQRTIALEAIVGAEKMAVSPLAFDWESDDNEIVAVDANGVLTGLRNGAATVTGTLDDKKITIAVKVEKPASSNVEVFDMMSTEGWTANPSSVKNVEFRTASEGDGLDVTYQVSSTRAPRLTLINNRNMYSCPDGMSVTLVQDVMALKGLTVAVKAANALRDVTLTADPSQLPEAGEIKTVHFDLADAFDLDDAAIYPIQFVSLSVTPPSKTDTFTLKLKGVDATYSYVTDGVDDVTVPAAGYSRLPVTVVGSTVRIPFEADVVEVFGIAGHSLGRFVSTSEIVIDTPGIYIVRAQCSGTTLSAPVIIR